MLRLSAPTVMHLDGYGDRRAQVEQFLTFTDKKIDFAYQKFKKAGHWFLKAHTQEEYELQLAALKADRKKCILFEDDGQLWTYSGLAPTFEEEFGDTAVTEYVLPEPELIPWAKIPKHEPRYYQLEAEDALIEASRFGPAAVEIGTGLGKTFIIERILKRLALRAVVMSPSLNIAEQIYDEMVTLFGKSKVGFYGDGKKELGKIFTVAVAASLRNVEFGSKDWDFLSEAPVFIADESHMCPAETLQQVCFGLVAAAPYRFFFSGTQMRQDGLDLVLKGIVGKIVYRMSVQEGVDRGFLAKPRFRMCWVDSNVKDSSGNLKYHGDANKMTRMHMFYNPDINAKAAEIANKAVSVMERPTVILIDEYEQFQHLQPLLRYEARFAHGPLDKKTKKLVPQQYWESDPKKLVDQFNRGDFPILVGTSCIAMGTDIQAVKMLLNLRGGMSEVEIRQAVGRTTRLFPGKEDCIYVDFGVKNVDVLKRHSLRRKEILQEIYPSYQEMNL